MQPSAKPLLHTFAAASLISSFATRCAVQPLGATFGLLFHVTTKTVLKRVQPFTAGLMTDEKLGKVDALQPLAAELGCTLPQVAVAWAASNPNVSSVILGATRVCPWRHRAPSSIDAAGSFG